MRNQPTEQDLEQAEKDSLYIALILRQRVRNAEAIHKDTAVRLGRSLEQLQPPTVALTVNEADILLKHFSGYAEKNMQLAGELAVVQQQRDAIFGAQHRPRRVTIPAGYAMNCEPTRYLSIAEVKRLFNDAGLAVDIEEPGE